MRLANALTPLLEQFADRPARADEARQLIELLTVSLGRPEWTLEVSSRDFSSLTLAGAPDAMLADLAACLQANGQGEVARVLVEARIAVREASQPKEEAVVFTAGRGNVLFRLTTGPSGWDLGMTSPMLDGLVARLEPGEEWISLLRREAHADQPARPIVPPPEDWQERCSRMRLEVDTVTLLVQAAASTVSSGSSSSPVDVYVKEQWKTFQQLLLEAGDNLPDPPAVENLRGACARKDRAWFRGTRLQEWQAQQEGDVIASLRARGEVQIAEQLARVEKDLPRFLMQEFGKQGVSAFAALGQELLCVSQGLSAELMKSRQQAERLRDRARAGLCESIESIRRASSSLFGSFQKLPFEEALEQQDLWLSRAREAELTRLVESFLLELQGRLHREVDDELRILEQTVRLLGDLQAGEERLRAEMGRVFPDASNVAGEVSLPENRRRALLEILHGMPSGEDRESLAAWFDTACKRVQEWSLERVASDREGLATSASGCPGGSSATR